MKQITSKSNETIKHIKSLNEKKFRIKYGEYYLEGIKVVDELLDIYNNKAIDIVSIACCSDRLEKVNGGKAILNKLKKIKDIEVINTTYEIFQIMTDTTSSQGILAVVKANNTTIDDFDYNSNILVLDKVQDSGNLGTIIRTADCFNVKNIICIEGTADVYSPKVLRSTMAAILKVNIIYLTYEEFGKNILKLKTKGYKVFGTSLQTDNYISKDIFNEKSVIVSGNEANGISDNIIKYCDVLVKIPISETSESLNVACSTAIFLNYQFKKNV